MNDLVQKIALAVEVAWDTWSLDAADERPFDETLRYAIRQALADAGEPVAWMRKNGFRFNGDIEPQDDSELPLYAHPASDRVAELEAQLAESRERETDWMSTAAAMLNTTYEQRKAMFESTCANYSAALAAEQEQT